MKQFLCIAIFATLAAFTAGTKITECRSKLPLPYSMVVDGCDQGPCELPKGSNVTIYVTFDAPFDLETFEPKLIARVAGIDVDYPMKEKNGCNELVDASCPLEVGQRVLYVTSMEVLEFYPPITFGIELTLSADNDDGDREAFLCFGLTGVVVD